MKKTILVYILMIISIAFLAILMNIPWRALSLINFSLKLHITIEILNSILMILIFFVSNNLYLKTKDERLAILAGGFLVGAIFNSVHMFTITSFPYDILSISNIAKNPTLIYLLIGNLILPLSIYASLIYKPSSFPENNFRSKVYINYFYLFLALSILPILGNYFLPDLAHNFNIIIHSLEFINYSLYIILASILINVKYNFRPPYFTPFIIGLIILGIGGLFYINPLLLSINEVLAHIFQILGFIFLLFGIKGFQTLSNSLRFKDELIAYMCLLLIAFYVVFIGLASGLFKITFPTFSAFVFVEFLLFFQLIIYAVSTLSWNKIYRVYISAERDRALIRIFESMRRISNPNIIKNTIIDEINKDFKADDCFIAIYNPTDKSLTYDKYLEKQPSKAWLDLDELDNEVSKFNKFCEVFENNIQICFANVEEYVKQNLLKGTPQEKLLKDYNIKSNYSISINYNNQLLGYLILQFTREYKDLSKDDLLYLQKIATQIGMIINQEI